MPYSAEFGRQTARAFRSKSKIGAHGGPGPFGRGTYLTPYKYAITPTHMGYYAKIDSCWSNGTSVRRKNRAPGVPPIKVTQGHHVRDRSGIHDFLSTFHGNQGPHLVPFPRNSEILGENC